MTMAIRKSNKARNQTRYCARLDKNVDARWHQKNRARNRKRNKIARLSRRRNRNG